MSNYFLLRLTIKVILFLTWISEAICWLKSVINETWTSSFKDGGPEGELFMDGRYFFDHNNEHYNPFAQRN
jgi:hypothetical protein